MKKLKCMLIGALMSVGVMVSAADPVYSVNVVGFNRITILSNCMAIVGVPFYSTVGNQTLEGVLGTNQLRAAAGFATADKVLVWDRATTNYITYAMRLNDAGYHVADVNFTVSARTNPPLYPGDALWIKLSAKSADTTITLMGDVVTDTAKTNAIGTGLNLVSLPFSQDIKLKDTGFIASGIKGAVGFAGADRIIVWGMTNKGYAEYGVRKFGAATNWYTCDVNWGTPAGLADDVVIPMGCGFWVKPRTTAFNWVQTNSYLQNLQ